MTNEEFSNLFDTLLNSYSVNGQFGEPSGKSDIAIDEYEKSVYLTQAQDIIVKSYFDKTLNTQAQGFDDSARRQVDFSSLVTVAELEEEDTSTTSRVLQSVSFDWDGESGALGTVHITNKTAASLTVNMIIYESVDDYQGNQSGANARIHNEALELTLVHDDLEAAGTTMSTLSRVILNTDVDDTENKVSDYINFRIVNPEASELPYSEEGYDFSKTIGAPISYEHSELAFDSRGHVYKMPSNGNVSKVLFILNEKLIAGGTEYVIVPINYQEYDREMSKAYSQPLKKQAWRLFQNTDAGFDIYSELIPRFDVDMTNAVYKIRYVRRPRPIVLGNLDGQSVDGQSTNSTCELNPILHMDILQKAVELALITRGGRTTTNS